MRLVDIMLSIPPILLAVLTVAVLGPGLQQPDPRARPHALAALHPRRLRARRCRSRPCPSSRPPRSAAPGAARLLFRHVLPNIAGAAHRRGHRSSSGLMILFEAGLSFLGLGIQPPTPSWGSIMSGRPATTWSRRGGSPRCPGCASSSSCWRSTCSATGCATASTRGPACDERRWTSRARESWSPAPAASSAAGSPRRSRETAPGSACRTIAPTSSRGSRRARARPRGTLLHATELTDDGSILDLVRLVDARVGRARRPRQQRRASIRAARSSTSRPPSGTGSST